jgi:multidrug efflux pump subunit AcrA (membrane-fusion protein)
LRAARSYRIALLHNQASHDLYPDVPISSLDPRTGAISAARPIGGVILERPIDPGQTIGADTVVYRLADLASPEVTAEVDELYAAELTPGRQAFVSMPRKAGTFPATIVHIKPPVDPATGTREVRLRLTAPPEGVAAGPTVSVNIVVDRREAAISIPRTAILKPENAPCVHALDGQGRVVERPVRFVDGPAADVVVWRKTWGSA